MFCKKCGRSLTENDKFCLDCGTPVDQMQEEVVFTTAEAPAPAPVKRSKAKLLIPIVAVVVLVGIVAAVLLSGAFGSDASRLFEAIANSVNAWNETSRTDPETVAWLAEAQEEYSGEMTVWLEDFPDLVQLEGFGIRADFDYSQSQRYFGMNLAPTFGYADLIHAQVVLKDNELYFGSQELTKDTYYMIHTDLLGQEMNALGAGVPELDSMGFNLFDMAQTMQEDVLADQAAIENLMEVFKTLKEQVTIEKTATGEIDVNGNALKADTYHVVIPQTAVSAILDAVEPIYMAQNSTEGMLEAYAAMGMDDETLEMLAEELEEMAAMQQETFDEARKAIEAMGDLEMDLYVSKKLVVQVAFTITVEEYTIDTTIDLGGGENYVDDLSVTMMDQNGEGVTLVSQGDHGGKSGTFTDKTTIIAEGESIGWELRYTPEAESDNLYWKINVADEVSIEMKGQLTLNDKEFFLRLDELKLAEGDYTLGTFGIEYRFGPYAPTEVDTSNYKVLAEMTDADMTAASTGLMMNAMEWVSWLQENFPELMSMLM